jgi:hypothetical protein
MLLALRGYRVLLVDRAAFPSDIPHGHFIHQRAYETSPPVTFWYFSYWYFSYWIGVPAQGLEVYVRHHHLVFRFPTNDALLAVFVAWPATSLKETRADVDRHVMAALDAIDGLGDRIRSGRRAERLYGATDLPNLLRKPWGPGWTLVGDATRFVLAREEMLPRESFFNPDNLRRVMDQAVVRGEEGA